MGPYTLPLMHWRVELHHPQPAVAVHVEQFGSQEQFQLLRRFVVAGSPSALTMLARRNHVIVATRSFMGIACGRTEKRLLPITAEKKTMKVCTGTTIELITVLGYLRGANRVVLSVYENYWMESAL